MKNEIELKEVCNNSDFLLEVKKFEQKWLNKGIVLTVKCFYDCYEGQSVHLIAKTKTWLGTTTILRKRPEGISFSPGMLNDLASDYELGEDLAFSLNSFILFTEIAKEFAKITKKIELKKGTAKISEVKTVEMFDKSKEK